MLANVNVKAKPYRAIAEYYDAENADQPVLEQDVPFFMGQLPHRRQSILELAVGTARAAIPLAQAGHRVVGVDYDEAMLEIARRKRDAVGLNDRQLKLIRADCLKLNLRETFDWVCVFFNTFLAFTTLEQQDAVLQGALRHLKPRGRFWVDLFQPDIRRLAKPKFSGIDPTLFYVPRYDRTVLKTVDLRHFPERQLQRVTFNYRWFTKRGEPRRKSHSFDLTYIFPRELRMLMERNGLRVEHLWGNYDGSPISANSPRMIARCCRM
jgi:ubiquinone/menaquinone biosynthesis C-methylase UbiE